MYLIAEARANVQLQNDKGKTPYDLLTQGENANYAKKLNPQFLEVFQAAVDGKEINIGN